MDCWFKDIGTVREILKKWMNEVLDERAKRRFEGVDCLQCGNPVYERSCRICRRMVLAEYE